jgi:ribosomal protein S18 acetylase RimI-like enzyme
MDEGNYSVRAFVEADYDAVARINTLIMPTLPETAEDLRRWDALTVRTGTRMLWRRVVVARRTGSTVAWGALSHGMWNYHPNKLYARVAVDPAHRRHGIGEELYRVLEGQAVAQHAVALWAGVQEDDRASVRFLERHGYVPLRKTWFSRLALDGLDLAGFPDRSQQLSERGLRITTLAAEGADRPEVRRRLYALSRITAKDVPRVGEYTPSTFEEFVDADLVGPRVLADATFLACRGDEYVGWSSLQ